MSPDVPTQAGSSARSAATVGRRTPRLRRWAGRCAALGAAALLAACGGGGGDPGTIPPASCSVFDRNVWLRDYMNDWYFWYAINPDPAPQNYSTLDSFFQASLYQGTSATFPADRWSYYTSTAAYNQFFGDGKTLGYGLMVAGLEVEDQPSQPLYVRYVEPGSPAAGAGLQRGDQVISLNGRSASSLISSGDFSVLSPSSAGQVLNAVVRNSGGDRSVSLSATVYDLVPVNGHAVLTTTGGRKLGYVQVKDMISQALTPLDTVFAGFRSAGVTELAIDLRYNGGGLVSTASSIASYPSVSRTSSQVFANLLYNDRKQGFNQAFRFNAPFNGLNLSRVYVLTGPRTCSASEQLINALSPFVDVVTVGDTTCGKPVGFLPQADGCGTTFSVVNFESVNARNEGRYFDGFAATCAVAENFQRSLGSSSEPLLSAAMQLADGGSCPTAGGQAQPMAATGSSRARTHWQGEPGDRFGGMLAQ